MNEQRIREIANESSYHAENSVDYYSGIVDGLTWEAKILKARDLKFAELIVKEMLVTCVEHPTWTGRMIGDQIKEHFGVEDLPVCKHDWYSAKNPVVQNGSVCVICGAIDAREPEELKNERH